MRDRRRRVWGVAVAVGLAAAVFAAIPRAEAKDPPRSVEPKGLVAVRAAMKLLATTQVGPVPGTPKEQALPMLADWSSIVTDWMTPLERSPYTLGAGVRGMVRLFVGDEGTDDLSIHLFVDDVDRERLRKFVMTVGRELGYVMHDSDDDRWSCFGVAQGRRDLWIGVGVGLVSIEASIP